MPDYRARVEHVIVIGVEALDWSCPQHITPRYTEAEWRALVRQEVRLPLDRSNTPRSEWVDRWEPASRVIAPLVGLALRVWIPTLTPMTSAVASSPQAIRSLIDCSYVASRPTRHAVAALRCLANSGRRRDRDGTVRPGWPPAHERRDDS